MVVVGINLLFYSVIMPVFTEYTVQSLRERLQESAQAVKQREREAAAKLKEMEEYLDLRALQARQVLSRCCCCCCCCCCSFRTRLLHIYASTRHLCLLSPFLLLPLQPPPSGTLARSFAV
jgi:Na+/melibiose symporter-like transporter